MRRSAQVLAPLLASAAALILTGCHNAEMQRCVNENNQVVDPIYCKNLPAGQAAQGSLNNNGGYYNNGVFIPHVYRNYYGGSGQSFLGGLATGGSYTPTPGHSYSFSGTTRGGFGSLFSGDGGEGGHGAHGGE